MIEDDFVSHIKRGEWYNQVICAKAREYNLELEISGYYKKNSLRGNMISAMQSADQHLLPGYVGTCQEIFQTLVTRVVDLSSDGSSGALPIEEKKMFVTRLKDAIFEVLIFLSEQKPGV